MVTPVAWGWGTGMAEMLPSEPILPKPYYPGRFIHNTVGSTSNRYPSYGGYDGYQSADDIQYRDMSDRFYAAAVAWLSGKGSGANVLLCTTADPTPAGHPFSYEFQDGLTRAGHTYTIKGDSGFTDGGSYDPVDYDVTFVSSRLSMPSPSYHGVAGTYYDRWEQLLCRDGGNIFFEAGVYPMIEWGFNFDEATHWYSDHTPPHPIPLDCEAEFGGADDYGFVQAANVSWAINLYQNANWQYISPYTYLCLNSARPGTSWLKTCKVSHPPEVGQPEREGPWGVLGFWTRD